MGRHVQDEAAKMKCTICKHGTTRPGLVSVTLERGKVTVVIKAVPADICDNCGEEYVSEETSRRVMDEAERAARSGAAVEILTYKAA